jgi:hypothetical protein
LQRKTAFPVILKRESGRGKPFYSMAFSAGALGSTFGELALMKIRVAIITRGKRDSPVRFSGFVAGFAGYKFMFAF